ncbi:hypothetical protein EDB92DRAFT_1862039 [Lactarius akahatsu]|uniref:Uncharacterized protein n=1 Tax=Lactarius akahatsu TaxID=416441 RepID=A0AAD4LL89_9AGAM|nr:hypothetical protein EDB92DRAFT_1862039 [Lactarius akahatsu]
MFSQRFSRFSLVKSHENCSFSDTHGEGVHEKGSPSANNGRRVAMFSKEQAKIPSDESATPTSSIGRNLSRLTFFSKASRKNLSTASNSSPPVLRHGTRRARHDPGSSMDAPVRLSAYMADMDYAPTHSSLDIRLEAPNTGTTQNDAEKSTERPDQSRESPFTRWIPTLLEITQDVEQFAQGSLEEIARLGQDTEREPPNLVLRRSEVRLLMCCASLPPAEFASTKGHSQPSAAKPYYPTGDPEQDKNIAFTTAMECCEVLKDLHSGNDAASIAIKYFELSQALSDLGLLHYASITSGFALETFRALHTTAPHNFGLSVASVLSLRANILADLEQDEEAVNAADGAVALCQHQRADPVPELVYALLNCAVLLCSVGRKQRGAAVALELVGLLGDANGSRLDTMHISSLCHLCRSDAHVGVDDALALSIAEEAIEISRNSSSIGPQAVLAGALFTKSKVLSSQSRHHLAHVASAEAVSLLRGISAQRHVFSLVLGHVLDTRSRQLLSANQIADSYLVAKEAVELWRALLMSAPDPIRRPLGWALVHQAKFRHRRSRRKAIREELGHAEFAVMLFRLVVPSDGAGLASALYLVADRMRELDERRAAAALAEEAVTRLQELSSEAPDVYSLDLIFSFSLASSFLSRTERASDALKYAKDAVEEQREREEAADDVQYSAHLCQLLRDVVHRFTEMGRQEEARPWFEEMQSLGHSGEIGELTTAYRRSALSGGHRDGEIRKETIYWIDITNGTSSLSQG